MLQRTVDWIVAASAFCGAVTLILMMLLISADVVGTSLFSSPVPAGSAIVTHYFMVLVVFLPMAMAEKTGSHVHVDVVFQLFPPRLRKAVGMVSTLFTALVCLGLVYGLWANALRKMKAGSYVFEHDIAVPTWPGQFVLPLGFGILALVLIMNIATLRVPGFEKPIDDANTTESPRVE